MTMIEPQTGPSPTGPRWPLTYPVKPPEVLIYAGPHDVFKRLLQQKFHDYFHDLRKLPNPWTVPAFRELTGLDPAVRKWLLDLPKVQKDLDQMVLETEACVKDRKDHPVGGPGEPGTIIVMTCYGGTHRSPALAFVLAQRLGARGIDTELRIFRPVLPAATLEVQAPLKMATLTKRTRFVARWVPGLVQTGGTHVVPAFV